MSEHHATSGSDDFLTAHVRYKDPGATESTEVVVRAGADAYTRAPTDDFRFASAVVEFGLVATGSQYADAADTGRAHDRAREAGSRGGPLRSAHRVGRPRREVRADRRLTSPGRQARARRRRAGRSARPAAEGIVGCDQSRTRRQPPVRSRSRALRTTLVS
ncbi:YfbK domain-containing protein [Cellulomonas hominis]|uniref:YfbK domain-containing protein n=1 Tax=Cellulomonas hominis TaxID=156981 RepID=UPI001BCB3591|nr:YfbK domain-containing protein [Cellulomonas hominis]